MHMVLTFSLSRFSVVVQSEKHFGVQNVVGARDVYGRNRRTQIDEEREIEGGERERER